MNYWNEHDLLVMDTRDKMASLKEKFDKKYGIDIKNYHKRLHSFLDRRLKNQSEIIMKQQLFLSVFFLYYQYRKV